MASVFTEMGHPLPEKVYSENCSLYTPGHPDGDFFVIVDKLDFFVPAHIVGWIVKVEEIEGATSSAV